MSTWRVLAVERLQDPPSPAWPSIFGPNPGADPISANGLGTVEMTALYKPIERMPQELERDLTKSGISTVDIDILDTDGSIYRSLGPKATTLGTATRWFGPWILIYEVDAAHPDGVLRGTYYMDEPSLTWSEDEQQTKFSATHASNIIQVPTFAALGIYRPGPRTPSTEDLFFTVRSGDDVLADSGGFTVRSDRNAREVAKWAVGHISWEYGVYEEITSAYGKFPRHEFGPVPIPPSMTIQIFGTNYTVAAVVWDDADSYLVNSHTEVDGHFSDTLIYKVAQIQLVGSPDLSAILAFSGDHSVITFVGSAETRTNYSMITSITAPTSGHDGETMMQLDGLDQIVQGDMLQVVYQDVSNGLARLTTTEIKVVGTDGERNMVNTYDPINEAIDVSAVFKIVNKPDDDTLLSVGPAMVSGIGLAGTVLQPFNMPLNYFKEYAGDSIIFSWVPVDLVTNPDIFNCYQIQGRKADGSQLVVGRRGGAPDATSAPHGGTFTGSWTTLHWNGYAGDSAATNRVYGKATQWPLTAPVIASSLIAPPLYIHGDTSGGSVPAAGWVNPWRSADDYTIQWQPVFSHWNGTALVYQKTAATGAVPPNLYNYMSTFAAVLHYNTSAGWKWNSWDGTTLGSDTTVTFTGASLPTGGYWIDLGMGVYDNGTSQQEGVIGLYATGPNPYNPWTKIQAVLMVPVVTGTMNVVSVQTLWDSSVGGHDPDGFWGVDGGLVSHTWNELFLAVNYPHSRVFAMTSNTAFISTDFFGVQVVPKTVCAKRQVDPAVYRVGGWDFLGIETYTDGNNGKAGRNKVRWISVDASLGILNGISEPDSRNPLNPTQFYNRGVAILDPCGYGSIPCSMQRITANATDELMGVLGGQLFRIRVGLGDTVGRIDMMNTVEEFIDRLSTCVLANFIPEVDGGMGLVSRNWGKTQARLSGGIYTSIYETEISNRKYTAVSHSFTSDVLVTFKNDVSDNANAKVDHTTKRDGGVQMQVDLGSLVTDISHANAVSQALADFFGQPLEVFSCTLRDLTPGFNDDKTAAFFSGWTVGDILLKNPMASGDTTPQAVWKIYKMDVHPDGRVVDIELIDLGQSIVITDL